MEWDAAFEEAGVEGSSPARQSAYRTIRVAKDGAKAEAKRLVDEAKEALAPFGDRAAPLIGIADYIIQRKN